MTKIVALVALMWGTCVHAGIFEEGSPSEKDISGALSKILPSKVTLKNLKVLAEENSGSSVEPLWRSRFSAVALIVDDLYVSDINKSVIINGFTPIKQSNFSGDTVDVYGISTSRIFQNKWEVFFDFEGDPLGDLGMPKNSFPSESLVTGSSQEDKYLAEMENLYRTFLGRWKLTKYKPVGKQWEDPNWGFEILSINMGGTWEINDGKLWKWFFDAQTKMIITDPKEHRNTLRLLSSSEIELTDRDKNKYRYVEY